jgi:O-antigen ligase
MKIKMKHTSLKHQVNTSSVGYFFLYLYSIATLMRFHEYSIDTSDWVIIKAFAIISFLAALFSKSLKTSPQFYMLLCLLPVVMLSALFNGWGAEGITHAQTLFVSVIIPFLLFSSLITTVTKQKQLMILCIIAALLMVFNGHLQQSSYDLVAEYGIGFGNSISVGKEEMRITYFGFFEDPNDLGMLLVMCLPFVAFFYNKASSFKKLFYLTIFILLCYGIHMTGSRGTLLGAIGMIGAFYLISKGGTKLVLFILISAPIGATLISSMGGMSTADASAAGRLYAWYDGILMLLSNPIFGVGMSNFREVHGIVAHNSYIHVAGELGILGYSLWGGVLTLNMYIGYVIIKKFQTLPKTLTTEDEQKNYQEEILLSRAIFFSMVGFMITVFFLSRQFTLLMYIFLGMQTASHYRIAKLQPDILELLTLKMVSLCMITSWSIIIVVYMTLQVTL